MHSGWRRTVAGVLAACCAVELAYPAQSADAGGGHDPVLLQIRVVEGEGAVHTTGTKASQPIVVRISDETGSPIAGASVSFRLPDEGPSGLFATGLKTEVFLTGADGRAAVRGIAWNRTAGSLQVRITANKGQARSGTVSAQYLSEPVSVAKRGSTGAESAIEHPIKIKTGTSRSKWLMLTMLIGGAAAGGVAAAAAGGSARGAASGPAAVTQPGAPPVSVGPPTVSIGKP